MATLFGLCGFNSKDYKVPGLLQCSLMGRDNNKHAQYVWYKVGYRRQVKGPRGGVGLVGYDGLRRVSGKVTAHINVCLGSDPGQQLELLLEPGGHK